MPTSGLCAGVVGDGPECGVSADGTTGFTVTAGDVAAMVERLELLLNDVERRKLLGRQGRWVAEKLFGMERMVAAYAREFRLLREQAG